jgi:hypothetical protein
MMLRTPLVIQHWHTLRGEARNSRKVVVFFIGEPPINPLDTATAITTAQP